MGIALSIVSVHAQDDEGEDNEKGFKKENLFTGGSITLSFFILYPSIWSRAMRAALRVLSVELFKAATNGAECFNDIKA